MAIVLTRPGRAGWWRLGLFAATMVAAAAVFLTAGPVARTVAFVGSATLTFVAVAWRPHVSRADLTGPWQLLAAAFGLYTLAISPWYVFGATGRSLPVPSAVDATFFASYALSLLVLRRISSRLSGQAPGWSLEIALVWLGYSAPIWGLWLEPLVGRLPLPTSATLVVYPAALLLLLLYALRLVFIDDHRGLRSLLLVGWLGGELAGNLYFDIAANRGTLSMASPWMLFYGFSWLCLGCAALAPGWTPNRPVRPAHEPSAKTRLFWMGMAAILPLLTTAILEQTQRRVALYPTIVGVAVLLLLLLRLTSLVTDLGAQQRARLELERITGELRHQSLHDTLTGLPNRTLLHQRILQAMRRRYGGRPAGALLWLDLDGFKAVNDALGHHVGDQMLIEVAARLRTLVRDGDSLARIGGDEFVILLPDSDVDRAALVADQVIATLAEPIDLGSAQLAPIASIGVAIADGTQDEDTLLKQADVAMYEAKLAGGGNYRIFSNDLNATVLRRHELSTALNGVARRDELELDYQPVMNLLEDRMTGVEALVRWRHPQLGLLSPLDWIPLAESNGCIGDVGAWVFNRACKQLLEWDRLHPDYPPMDMAVNVSHRQLDDPELVSGLETALQTCGIDPARVILEVTESVLVTDPAVTIRRLEQLKALGCQIAIDDFGTGYSSLSVLRQLPIDLIKIDKAFVDGIATNSGEWAFATTIVRLANTLGKHVIAEGIETGDQLAHLIALRCRYGQGYLFSRPVSAEQISQQMRAATAPKTFAGAGSL